MGPFAARDVQLVDAGISTREHFIRPLRMRRKRPDARLGIHARRAPETLQRFTEVIAVPDGKSCGPDIETRRHRFSLSSCLQPCIELLTWSSSCRLDFG